MQGAWITSFGDAQSGAIAVNGTVNLPVSAASLAATVYVDRATGVRNAYFAG